MIRVQWFANGFGTSHAWAKPLVQGSRSLCGMPWSAIEERDCHKTHLKLYRCWRCKDRLERSRKKREVGRR